MSADQSHLGQVVVAFTMPNPDCTHFIGEMVTYADFPTVGVTTADGKQSHWAARLTRRATTEETIEYWRNRARDAEEKLRAAGGAP